jgi:hypothetical protein
MQNAQFLLRLPWQAGALARFPQKNTYMLVLHCHRKSRTFAENFNAAFCVQQT